jgi:cytochrome c biogenesis protein ResB
MIGLIIFIAGAIWGGMIATDGMVAEDIYWPAVMMLSGAMITLLGTTFGTDHEDDRSNDLNDAIMELTDRINRLVGSSDKSDESE